MVLNDLAVPDTIDAIARAARELGEGDALVLVTPVDDLVRLPRAADHSSEERSAK